MFHNVMGIFDRDRAYFRSLIQNLGNVEPNNVCLTEVFDVLLPTAMLYVYVERLELLQW